LLIKKGADVNAKTHDQGYTALMFASISNNIRIVDLLLEHDADVDYQNKIGRTACQMAVFVNSNESADLIKAHLPKKALEYYTNINSISEDEPKLPKGECFDELYNLLTKSINYSPVRILKTIKFSLNNVLAINSLKIIRTLDAFSTKVFKYNENGTPNDILAFKLHYYKYIFEYLITQKSLIEKKESNLNENELYNKLFDVCIKRLISEENIADPGISSKSIKHRLFEEKFLRESIRKFDYPEAAIIKQMVTILAKTQIGNYPTALNVISDCLNGQRFNEDNLNIHLNSCATCLTRGKHLKMCTHCRNVAYCDQYCQRLHWSIHKKEIINK
jgi:ankyrin repeat protein